MLIKIIGAIMFHLFYIPLLLVIAVFALIFYLIGLLPWNGPAKFLWPFLSALAYFNLVLIEAFIPTWMKEEDLEKCYLQLFDISKLIRHL